MKNQKKKVLVLASTFPRWKNDTTPPFVFELEKRLTKNFDIYVLAPHHSGAKKYEEMEGLKVYRFQYFWPAKWQKLCYEGGILPNIKKNRLLIFEGFTLIFFELLAAINLIRKHKFNLIHAHWIIPQGPVALVLHKFFKIPFIVTTHGGDIYGLQNKILMSIKKNVLENAKSITVVSSDIKKEIHKKINKNLNVQIIPMGVDSNLFHPDKYDESIKKRYKINGPLLLFVGRLAEKKGVRYLIEAMSSVVKERPEVKLFIIGEGPEYDSLLNLVKELDIEKNVLFLGAIPNAKLPNYYATADIFIGPSIKTKDGDTEGFGLTFVEAAFSGTIPIGSNVGGINDIIKDKNNGLLIKEKNSEDITKKIYLLLNDEKLFMYLKNNSRKNLVKEFESTEIISKYTQVYLNNYAKN